MRVSVTPVKTVASDLFHTKRQHKKSQQKKCHQKNQAIQILKTPEQSTLGSHHSVLEKLTRNAAAQSTHAASLMDQLYPEIPVGIPRRRLLRLLQQVSLA